MAVDEVMDDPHHAHIGLGRPGSALTSSRPSTHIPIHIWPEDPEGLPWRLTSGVMNRTGVIGPRVRLALALSWHLHISCCGGAEPF